MTGTNGGHACCLRRVWLRQLRVAASGRCAHWVNLSKALSIAEPPGLSTIIRYLPRIRKNRHPPRGFLRDFGTRRGGGRWAGGIVAAVKKYSGRSCRRPTNDQASPAGNGTLPRPSPACCDHLDWQHGGARGAASSSSDRCRFRAGSKKRRKMRPGIRSHRTIPRGKRRRKPPHSPCNARACRTVRPHQYP